MIKFIVNQYHAGHMKNLILILIFFSTSIYGQNNKLKLKPQKSKYQNIYFKSPDKYKNKVQEFIVNQITFHTSYKDSKSKNKYQISVKGTVNNNKEKILYNAKNIGELEYYTNIFKGRYKKIILFEYSYLINSKKYHDSSISVQY